MAARPTWKGFLKISLVNIPIRVFPATDSAATISFNQLHAECQTRIQQKRWCPKCDREVPMSEIAKGYEFEKGRYVVVTEDDMSKVRPESTRVIDLVQFTEASSIDPLLVERFGRDAGDFNQRLTARQKFSRRQSITRLVDEHARCVGRLANQASAGIGTGRCDGHCLTSGRAFDPRAGARLQPA